jgi:hypothetical protein
MKIPFTSEQFLQLFKDYNQAIFPLQIIFNLIAIITILLCFSRKRYSDKIINSVLAFFWLWMGIVYHWIFFTSINKAAYVFGAAFIIQGILFLYYGFAKSNLRYRAKVTGTGLVSSVFIIFALIFYPLLGIKLGHVYPASPTFGLPCPTTIFTFGILLWSDGKIPKVILFIPLLWVLVGFTAAIKLGMSEDISLLISGIIMAAIAVFQRKKSLPGVA